MTKNDWFARAYYGRRMAEAHAAVLQRESEIGDSPHGEDVTWLQNRLAEQLYAYELLNLRIDELAKRSAGQKLSRLGKEYGRASRTIHELRAENALLRQELREK